MSDPPDRALDVARRVVIGLAAVWLVVLLVVFALRIGFALELEWMEGGSLQSALRLQSGLPLYGPPSAEFVPFLYTPLYPAMLAVLGLVFPLGYVLGRAVSWLAFLAICGALWHAVGHEGKPLSHRAAAVGLFCAGYVFSFRWLDLARPDTLFLALLAWGLVVLRRSSESHWRAALAGVLVALAFWTKQTAIVFVVASGFAGLLVAPRRLWAYVAAIAVTAGGGVLVGDALTDGWLWTYVYELHQGHAFNRERFWVKTWGMFAHAAPALVVLVVLVVGRPVLSMIRGGRRPAAGWPGELRGTAYWAVLALAGLLASALGYATQWAEPNAFLPGMCFGALAFAVALPTKGARELTALVLVAAQLGFALVVEPRYQPIQSDGLAGLGRSYTWHDPHRSIPSAAERARARALRQALEDADGEVFALHRPWWNVIAGGNGHAGAMGLHDVPRPDRRRLERDISADVRRQRYGQVWLEGEPPKWLRAALRHGYRLERRLSGDERVRPLSGYMSEAGMVTAYERDQLMYVPRARAGRPQGR